MMIPEGYRVEKLKHQDGGFLVLGPQSVVVGLAKSQKAAEKLARAHARVEDRASRIAEAAADMGYHELATLLKGNK